jgi:hypothetical protein
MVPDTQVVLQLRYETRGAYRSPHPRYENIAWLMGDEGDMAAGSQHVWNFKNGLIIETGLERSFDRGDFIIVPIFTSPGQPQRLRFVLLNHALSHHRATEHGPRYSELDGTELEFKSAGRPGLRYLYFRYVTTLLRAIRWKKTDWDSLKKRFPDGPIWATPGPYLRKGMLRQLALSIGDLELQTGDFQEGICEGTGEKDVGAEKEIAQRVLQNMKLGDDFDVEDSDCDEE